MNIEMKGIDKSFGTNQVLKSAGFQLKDGEVHALMGENGAGKSTLMKILTGVYTKDAGTVLVDGREVVYKNPQEAEKDGIVFIYQELNVLYDLTVEENLFMGKEITKFFGICDKKAMRAKAQEIMDRMGVKIPVTAKMSDLSVGQQQMVEICKALMVDAKVLIMDEPTAALTQSETEILFDVIKSLRKKGVSIVYISHRMEEIFELCDRITVLRDGTYIDTKYIKDIDMDDIVQMMIGRTIGERFPKREAVIGEEVLRVEGLSHEKLFRDVSFSVRAGEVLGVSGLMGAGRTEIAHAIFGNIPVASGKIYIDGKEVSIKNPREAIQAGIGFITEDRKTEGLLLEKSIAENIEIANLNKISIRSVLSKVKQSALVNKGIDEFHIKCFGPAHECNNLSGGNQQKVVLAKWLSANPKLLILDNPTQGVDVGAKEEIYQIIQQLADQGVAVVVLCSEAQEMIRLCDRALVMYHGSVRAEVSGEAMNEHEMMRLATGG